MNSLKRRNGDTKKRNGRMGEWENGREEKGREGSPVLPFSVSPFRLLVFPSPFHRFLFPISFPSLVLA